MIALNSPTPHLTDYIIVSLPDTDCLTVKLDAEVGIIANFRFLSTAADKVLHVRIPVCPANGDVRVLF